MWKALFERIWGALSIIKISAHLHAFLGQHFHKQKQAYLQKKPKTFISELWPAPVLTTLSSLIGLDVTERASDPSFMLSLTPPVEYHPCGVRWREIKFLCSVVALNQVSRGLPQ